MHMLKKMRALAAVFCCFLFVAVACQKEPVIPEPSATDTLPCPVDVNKDTSTNPGDDFWQYCNGSWYAQAAMPSSGATGGVYDVVPVMDEMVQTIIREDPSLKRFYQLSDELYDHSDAAMAYLSSLMAKYPQPAAREDCLRMFGRMIMDGISPIAVTLVNDYKDGKMIGLLAVSTPGITTTYKYAFSDLPEAVKPDLKLIAEGMGLDAETLYYNDQTLAVMNYLVGQPAEVLYSFVQSNGFPALYPYVSEELNASLGDDAKTPDQVRQAARFNLNYLISNRLVVKYITPELKQHYLDMMDRIRDAFRIRIQNLDWMSETTKVNALDKLDKMKCYAGSPDNWYEDCLPDLSQCGSLLEAVHKLMVAKTLLYKHLIGTDDTFSNSITQVAPISLTEMVATDLTMVNSYYKPEFNAVVILPAFMLPPLLRVDYSEAFQYEAIVPVAHEITHGFDSIGANYDAYGRIRNWWTVADKMAFEDEQAKLVRCYSTLEFDPAGYPGQYTDGARTLSENIADLGGFLLTLDAYKKRLEEQGFTGENYAAQLRKFYESYANVHRVKYSTDKLSSIITEDVHSHCRLRVNGVVMNTDTWYELYDVDRNDALYLPQERRTYIW